MYLSKLKISNYRSIKNLDLKFFKGKNVIVGKNNAGKSNIIRAIDLLLGEGSPTYHKSENITEKDFHCGDFTKPIFIFCELTRDENESLNYDEIYKCLGFKYHAEDRAWDREQGKWVGNSTRHILSETSLDAFWSDLDAIMNIGEDEVTNVYVNPKLKHQQAFEDQLENKYCFAFAFRATINESKRVHKEIRFFYREDSRYRWIMAFSAPVRCEFLQSAIIPSFRDPSNELRISQWGWYGKLLKNYINSDDKELREAFTTLKLASDGVFENLKTAINNSKVRIAFPGTQVSFQFNPEAKVDVYKSALIYVDDGFNSLLQDKGSGIQSAVIIGLFHYYTRNIAHASCSLLAIEEPEVYLHPQARRVISNRLDDFLEGGKNQVIMTSHSPEFIANAHDDLNIVLVTKTAEAGTVATNTSFTDSKEKQILVKIQNSEMFFADSVILVEGGDKYILEMIAQFYGREIKPFLGPNWLNDKNVSVISVGGKSEFWKYYKKLSELKIQCFILADFDFFLRKFNEFLTNVGAKQKSIDEVNTIKGRLGIQDLPLKKKVIEAIDDFQAFLDSEGLELNYKEIRVKLKDPFKTKKLSQIDTQHHESIRLILDKYRALGICFLENELEDYYTEDCKKIIKSVGGKEERPIYIASKVMLGQENITDLIEHSEFVRFLDKITSVYNVEDTSPKNDGVEVPLG